MATIENLLGQRRAFKVDPIACMEHAKVISKYERPQIESPLWNYSPAVKLTCKTAFISICHQFNWDFLHEAVYRNLLKDADRLAERLAEVSASDVSQWLDDYPKRQRIKARERARILRDVGDFLVNQFSGDLGAFAAACEVARLGDGSFHSLLDGMVGFRVDPLRKKTNVLTHEIYKEKIIELKDPENIQPAVDYHIMRLYLRTGLVIPADRTIFPFLTGAPNPRGALVRALRESVSEAELLTARYAGLNVADVNYIEWQVGRQICLNKDPRCIAGLPEAASASDIQAISGGQCPYRPICLSYNNLPEFLEFEEPEFVSTYY